MEFVAETLKDNITKAVVSKNLKSHPVFCPQKVQFLLKWKIFSQMPGDEPKPKASKVLELNADHAVFEALKNAYNSDKAKAEKLSKILYNQALLIAGLSVENPVEYCDLVCSLF